MYKRNLQDKLFVNGYMLSRSDGEMSMYSSDGRFMGGDVKGFAKAFFSENKGKNIRDPSMNDMKMWILASLYLGEMRSLNEIMDMTGYKSTSMIQKSVKEYGSLRNYRDGTNLAFESRHNMSRSAFAKKQQEERWKNDQKYRDAVSNGLMKYWERKRSASA